MNERYGSYLSLEKIFMKKILMTGLFLALYTLSFAQKPGWQHLDLHRDSLFGMSTDRAYKELLKGKKSKKVVVAILDSGIDTLQEDLQSIIWTDVKTGHHGYNYLASESGQEDLTRLVQDHKALYDSLSFTEVPEQYRKGYQSYRNRAPQLKSKKDGMQYLVTFLDSAKMVVDTLYTMTGKAEPTPDDFKNLKTKNEEERQITDIVEKRLSHYKSWVEFYKNEITNIRARAMFHLEHGLNLDNNEAEQNAGNFDISPDKLGVVLQPNLTAYHGTIVSGIVGALRNNGKGMDGVADNVRLMSLKVLDNIRELRDHNLAEAIIFAVDHGARVINMSLGKYYTYDKTAVDKAVKYAMSKDVLIVRAAGNDGKNTDKEGDISYPTRDYLDKGTASNWIVVGASGPKNDATIYPYWSNYGQHNVDVFAPGVQVYSTVPYNQYSKWDGTSIASPMVAGLAALIWEYYPKLTATQIKDIIMKSVVKSEYLKTKCISGGVVNTYNALKLAATY
jgi:subtilisin family serine protease